MRRKASWAKAIALAQQQPDAFEHWLKNPPDEYKELFTEAETTVVLTHSPLTTDICHLPSLTQIVRYKGEIIPLNVKLKVF